MTRSDSVDVKRWRAKYALIERAAESDKDAQALFAELDFERAARNGELREILADLVASSDLLAFKEAMNHWARKDGPYVGFGPIGIPWLAALVRRADEEYAEVVDLLKVTLQTPASPQDAADKLQSVDAFLARGGSRGQRAPAPGHTAYVLSLFWSTDDAGDWPLMWENAPHMLQRFGWLERGLSHAERYVAFADLCHALRPDDPRYAARILWHFKETEGFVGIAPNVLDVCVEAAELASEFRPSSGYATPAQEERAADLARQLRGEADHISDSLIERLGAETGLYLEAPTLALQQLAGEESAYRSDLYAAWILVGGAGAPGFRLWVTRSGVAFGLHGGWEGESDQQHREVGALVQDHLPRGLNFFRVHEDGRGDRLELAGREYPSGETFVGRWWKDEEALGRADFADDIISTARALTPLLRFMSSSQRGDDPSLDLASMVDLATEVEIFRTERPYPTERDAWHQEQRRIFAACLSREGLEDFDLPTFKRIVSTRGYGDIGAQSVLISSINALDASGIEQLRNTVRELLWGEGRDEERINRVLSTDDVPVQGFGETVVLKLFAIAHPEHWLPLFSLGGDSGKAAMLARLGGPARWTEGKSRGRMHVETNALLRQTLDPLLPDDPWGQGQLAHWLMRRSDKALTPDKDALGDAAADLLIEESFLREIKGLLEEKKQVIFYGPPGTGKTYLAQRFATALQPDPAKRDIVQFHPSSSYEDFFEGFRPQIDHQGQMVYELRKGPLALLAEAAEADPLTPHIMIIDEINRANLPRVFGELLFLLEYRSHSVKTSYRPDEGFELPPNLYFIGTMNTADRSIALVDAALRRRFDFVPFMPHDGPMQGLLRRWLEAHDGPVWVADLVDRVNEDLRRALRGPHLQIGHSYFMRPGLDDDEATLRRIWDYNVYPFIEDQLYGREHELAQFRWENVRSRYGQIDVARP
ncbi:5-methylcytosine-specific restriction protein B [Humibacillus xanthopallidus]|uniref:5-methylcytosine-specific restriction protein B n=1 Tax=Humibacillus xanthopallidus TaxID=412689 RepID=A0A543PW75_9MICO|nr:AAA family ATPase [Humibacillus xanthopallidus]TQN48322.1 5-methylcytosine-specific restriction protein B [Humibacillus xanthopallidus]